MTNNLRLFPRLKRRDNELVNQYRHLFILLPVVQDWRGWRFEPTARPLGRVVVPLVQVFRAERQLRRQRALL